MVTSSPLPRKRVVLLGATGSIGENTLRVIAAHPDKLELVGIGARSNWEKLAEIARTFDVQEIALYDDLSWQAASNSGAFARGTRVRGGLNGLVELAQLPDADIVLVAIAGTTGLHPALAAIEAGKDLALASKEILVLAGSFVMAAAKKQGSKILPVDSEHNAVFQCLEGHPNASVRRVILTASGGAFRDWPVERLAHVTPADAIKHPNWSMGPKITVDSATLANKGLELIEAQCLFGLRSDQCEAVLHPQSIVHALVEFNDGAMLSQLCPPSMTFPIQHALLYPRRAPGVEPALDLSRRWSLEFSPVDENRFPMMRLAHQSMSAGGVTPAIYNAANEVAVAAFLAGRIPFLAIPRVVEQTMGLVQNFAPSDLTAVITLDREARRVAATQLTRLST